MQQTARRGDWGVSMGGGAGSKWRTNRILMVAAALAAPIVANAQVSGTWINPNSGTWVDGANWSSNPLYPDGGGTAVFPSNTWNTTTISLGGSGVTVSQFEFHGPTAYRAFGNGSITLVGSAILFADEVAGAIPDTAPAVRHDVFLSLTGSSGLTKEGSGQVLLWNTTYTGNTTINDGTILVTSSNAGFGAATNTITLNGGAISSRSNDVVLNQPIVVTGAGGVIGIAGLETSPSSGELDLNAPVSGLGSLLFNTTSSSHEFFVGDAISVIGAVEVHGNMTLRNNGAITSTPQLHLRGLLTLNNGTSTTSTDRLANSIPITLDGGGIRAIRAQGSTGTLVEQTGTIALLQSLNSITVFEGTQLVVPQIVRSGESVLQVDSGASDVTLQISNPPPLSGSGVAGTPEVGIIPWARQIGTGTTTPSVTALPMTVEGGNLRRLAASEYITSVPVGVTSSNLRLSGSASIATVATVNSLRMDSGTLSGSGTLIISSGALFAGGIKTSLPREIPVVIQAPIDFGSAEGIVHTPVHSVPLVTIEGAISGSGGLILAGAVDLRGNSTYTGRTTVLNWLDVTQDVREGQAGPLGLDTSAVRLHGGAELAFRPRGTAIVFERDLEVGDSGAGDAFFLNNHGGFAPSEVTVAGDIMLNGNLVLDSASMLSGSHWNFSGDISGPGRILSNVNNGASSGYFTFTGNNSFTGGFQLRGGTLELGTDSALGSGTFWFGGGQISAVNGPRTIENAIVMTGSFGAIVGSQSLVLNGSMNLLGATRTLTISNSATTTFVGPIFNGSLIKTGTGIMQTSNIRLPAFTTSQGLVRILPNGTDTGTSRVNSLTIEAGASVDLTNNDLVIDYLTASPLAIVQQALSDARLFSSFAISGVTGLGYAENSDLGYTTFSGQPVDLTSVLVAYTYMGDTDLNGAVDLVDFDNYLDGFAPTEAAALWITGDFNYSGTIDLGDFELYLNGYYALGGSISAITNAVQDAPVSEQDRAAMLNLVNTVPEPMAMGLAGLLPALFIRRRRNS